MNVALFYFTFREEFGVLFQISLTMLLQYTNMINVKNLVCKSLKVSER